MNFYRLYNEKNGTVKVAGMSSWSINEAVAAMRSEHTYSWHLRDMTLDSPIRHTSGDREREELPGPALSENGKK